MKPIQIGDEVGDYRVIDMAGSGGMGTVFKIEHVITKRIEAMKLLPPGARDDPEQVQRFEREIQVQARLHHPNIVALYNAVRHGNSMALVMEYVEGESLQRMLEAGPLDVTAAAEFTSQLLNALAYAHAAGVVHRDVGPANIIITRDRTAKLTDFGLARAATDVRLSTSGVPLGSPWYMSPEQVRGIEELDGRTDLYSMGAVLHEMLTGEKLFDVSGAFAVMRAQVEAEPVLPSCRNPKVPAALDEIVRKAVAKLPAMRFQSADEFRLALWDAMAVVPPVVTHSMPAPPVMAIPGVPLPVAALPMTARRMPALPTVTLPVAAPRRSKAPWAAAIPELASRLRGYRPSHAAMLMTVVASGLLAGLYAVRFLPDEARARATASTRRTAAVSRQVAPQVEPPMAPQAGPPVAPPVELPVLVRADPAPAVVPTMPPAVPAEAQATAPRVRRRAPMGPAYKPPPKDAIRVTGGEAERAAAMPAPNTHHRQLAEAPEPSAPPVNFDKGDAAAVALALGPEGTMAPPVAAPQKPQNGNRLVKALGKVNPFKKRTKPNEGETGKTVLTND